MKIKVKRYFIINLDNQYYFVGYAGLALRFEKKISNAMNWFNLNDAENVLKSLYKNFDTSRYGIVLREIEI